MAPTPDWQTSTRNHSQRRALNKGWSGYAFQDYSVRAAESGPVEEPRGQLGKHEGTVCEV
jgi:hypothetical protein